MLIKMNEDVNNRLLSVRITIVMVREKFTFLDAPGIYKVYLKRYFNIDYNIEEIEKVMYELEEAHIIHHEQGIIDFPEDFKLI
jgi:hypothetical protein